MELSFFWQINAHCMSLITYCEFHKLLWCEKAKQHNSQSNGGPDDCLHFSHQCCVWVSVLHATTKWELQVSAKRHTKRQDFPKFSRSSMLCHSPDWVFICSCLSLRHWNNMHGMWSQEKMKVMIKCLVQRSTCSRTCSKVKSEMELQCLVRFLFKECLCFI